MTALTDLVTRIRLALSLDASYETAEIPYAVQRQGIRLLRDYHFPWAVVKQTYGEDVALIEGAQDYVLPVGFKKDLAVLFYDVEGKVYSAPLGKRGGFTLPGDDGVPRYYWLWNGNLSTDISLPVSDAANTRLLLWYESLDWEANSPWMLERFEDLLFTVTCFRFAAEKGKQELAQTYGGLWADDRQALAIYANELEFGNGVWMQHEARSFDRDRYPAG